MPQALSHLALLMAAGELADGESGVTANPEERRQADGYG
jgi:hypothetical protein